MQKFNFYKKANATCFQAMQRSQILQLSKLSYIIDSFRYHWSKTENWNFTWFLELSKESSRQLLPWCFVLATVSSFLSLVQSAWPCALHTARSADVFRDQSATPASAGLARRCVTIFRPNCRCPSASLTTTTGLVRWPQLGLQMFRDQSATPACAGLARRCVTIFRPNCRCPSAFLTTGLTADFIPVCGIRIFFLLSACYPTKLQHMLITRMLSPFKNLVSLRAIFYWSCILCWHFLLALCIYCLTCRFFCAYLVCWLCDGIYRLCPTFLCFSSSQIM